MVSREQLEKDLSFCDKVFVYGTLRVGECNNPVMGASRHLGTTMTSDMMNMSGRGIPFIHFAPPTCNKKAFVVGDLFEVPDVEHLRRMDGLEGHPDWYERHVIYLQNGERAWCYLNVTAFDNPNPPNSLGYHDFSNPE